MGAGGRHHGLFGCVVTLLLSLIVMAKTVLPGWLVPDTQAFSPSGAEVDGFHFAALDSLHDGLARHAVGEGGLLLLTVTDAANQLGLAPSTLHRWLADARGLSFTAGRGPVAAPPCKISAAVLPVEDVRDHRVEVVDGEAADQVDGVLVGTQPVGWSAFDRHRKFGDRPAGALCDLGSGTWSRGSGSLGRPGDGRRWAEG